MILMPHQEGWLGQALSTSPDFDAYAEPFGGVARGQTFEIEQMRLQQEYVLAILIWENLAKTRGANADGVPFDTRFGILQDDHPDAFAGVKNGVHYCGLSTGLVRSAFYLASEIVLLRDLVPGFGGRVTGINMRGHLDLLPDPDRLAQSERLAAEALYSAPPRRVAARDHLAHLLVTFAIHHEFNHAISGHAGFMARTLGIGRLHEHGSRTGEGITTDLHRDIEYMADLGAIESMFDYLRRGALLRRLYRHAPRPAGVHRLFLIALALLCGLWNRMNRAFGPDGFHPEPQARWAAALRLYTLLLQAHYPLGRWSLIVRPAMQDIARLMADCPDMLGLTFDLAGYGSGSDFWRDREPQNLTVRSEDVAAFVHPPLKPAKVYRDRRLRALLGRTPPTGGRS